MKINWFKINKKFMLISELFIGSPYMYCLFLIYLKQGQNCKDCEEDCFNCNCNFCENCEYRFCLCDLNIKNTYEFYYDDEFSIKIREIFYNWVICNISINNIKKLIIKIRNYISSNKDNLSADERNLIFDYVKLYENQLV